jgi:hypothetical protein
MPRPPNASMPPISVSAAIERSIQWTKWILFEDFEWGKWFVLGFCAFLADLSSGGGSFRFSGNFGDSYGDKGLTGLPWDGVRDFVVEHVLLLAGAGLVVMAALLAIWVFLLWLSSRGVFMFLDGVIHNRARVSEPWHRFRHLSNSLFLGRLVLFAFGAGATLMVAALGTLIAWPDIEAGRFGPGALGALLVGIFIVGTLFMALLLVHQILSDFAVLIMYRRNVYLATALHILRREILPGRLGAVVRFYLMKLLLYIAISLVIIIGGCLTCCLLYCITALPYIGSVVLLPVSVFVRGYSIFFFEQCAPRWRLFPEGAHSENSI